MTLALCRWDLQVKVVAGIWEPFPRGVRRDLVVIDSCLFTWGEPQQSGPSRERGPVGHAGPPLASRPPQSSVSPRGCPPWAAACSSVAHYLRHYHSRALGLGSRAVEAVVVVVAVAVVGRYITRCSRSWSRTHTVKKQSGCRTGGAERHTRHDCLKATGRRLRRAVRGRAPGRRGATDVDAPAPRTPLANSPHLQNQTEPPLQTSVTNAHTCVSLSRTCVSQLLATRHTPNDSNGSARLRTTNAKR